MSSKNDYTLRYQIRATRVSFVDYIEKRGYVQNGQLLGKKLYPPSASINNVKNLGKAVITPEELETFVKPPPSIQASNSVLPPTIMNNGGIVQWATNVDGSSTDEGRSIATDSLGNIYVTGIYSASMTLKNVSGNTQVNSSITLPAPTGQGVFIVKYNSSGIVQWATNVDGVSSDIGYSIAIDSLNNIYVTGIYRGSIRLKNASGNTQVNSSITLPAPGDSEGAFIVKYNSSGIAQWATNVDSSFYDGGRSIATDSLNNIYVTGYYEIGMTLKNASGNGQVNSSITLPTPPDYLDIFVVKYNSSGIVQWATNIFSLLGGGSTGYSIAIDSLNNIYVTGLYKTITQLRNASGNGQVNSSITLPAPNGFQGAFIVKYNSSGIVQWATNVDGILFDIGYSIAIDSLDNIYVTGYYEAGMILKNASGNGQVNSSITLPAPTGQGAFIVKYNSSGIVQWATNVDGSSTDQGLSIATDSLNNIYLTGIYSGSMTLKNASGNTEVNSSITLPAPTGQGAFIVKYNSSGIVQWATNVDGSSTDQGLSIASDSLNNIYVTGIYNGSMTLKNASGNTQVNSSITLPTPTGQGAFIVKYS